MKADKRIVCINGVPVFTEKENIECDTAAMKIHTGSTGLCGGDRREGGRTYVSIENAGETDMIVTLNKGKDGNGTGFEIAASGDDALVALAYAFAAISAKLLNTMTGEEEE